MLLAVLALLGEARRPPGVGQEAGVAAPALPAAGGEVAVAVAHEVGEQLAVAGLHLRALGHRDHEVGAAGAVALVARPVLARLGPAVRVVAVREQRRHVAVGLQVDVAAGAAVAAVGPALGDVGLAPERHRARAAVAAAEVDLDDVDERRTCRSA